MYILYAPAASTLNSLDVIAHMIQLRCRMWFRQSSPAFIDEIILTELGLTHNFSYWQHFIIAAELHDLHVLSYVITVSVDWLQFYMTAESLISVKHELLCLNKSVSV